MSPPRILIVEDEIIVARDLKDTLNRLGYDAYDIASDGREAVAKAEDGRADLVLMDIVLKGEMDGVRSAETIRKKCSIPVVYLTAHGEGETLERAKQTEPFGYILKPFTERELKTNIEIALYRQEMERERDKLLNDLQKALFKIKTLEGILPICAHCKRIRDKDGKWHEVSDYIEEHSRAEFTHGICPDCAARIYSQIERENQ